MGTWGIEPWESDLAADWFAKMFEETKLDDFIEKTLCLDSLDYYEEIRAAAAVLVGLGRKGIWPTEKLDQHLKLAIAKLEEILGNDSCPVNESKEIVAAITKEIECLKARLVC